jgi:hypothetical protein
MNNKSLIRLGLIERAKKALVDGKRDKAFCLLKWAREMR